MIVKAIAIHFETHRFVCIGNQLFDLWHNVLIYINIHMTVISIQIFLKITITHFVEIFKLSKIICLLLNCIIRKMHKFIAQIIVIEFPAASSDIAIFIKVSFHVWIYARDKTKHSEIKFPSINKQRIINILLNNDSFISTIPLGTNYRFYII